MVFLSLCTRVCYHKTRMMSDTVSRGYGYLGIRLVGDTVSG